MATTKPMHRLSAVRRQQGVSLDDLARRLNMPVDRVMSQGRETSDLQLSELWAWQDVLAVPVGHLLIDRAGPVQDPELERAQMHRLLKIASSIRERAQSRTVQRLAEAMIAQLVEIMPEEDL